MDNYVVNPKLAKKMKTKGYPQLSKFYWHSLISHDMKRWSDYKLQDYKPDSDFGMRVLAAPMAEDILEQLPNTISSKKYKDHDGNYQAAELWQRKSDDGTYFVWYFVNGIQNVESEYGGHADRPVDALAELWLWCNKHGYVPNVTNKTDTAVTDLVATDRKVQ